MNQNLKSVIRTYKDEGIVYHLDGKCVTHMACMDDSGNPVVQQVVARKKSVVVATVTPFMVDTDDIPMLAMKMSEINSGLIIGGFLVLDNGILAYKSSIFTGKRQIDHDELLFHLALGASMVDQHIEALKGCCGTFGTVPLDIIEAMYG